MATTHTTASDLLRSLDPDEIRARLTEIDGERRALMTLLRAAQSRGANARQTNKRAAERSRETSPA